MQPLEKDLTTQGVSGDLRCPFARVSQISGAGSSRSTHNQDPIAAELHAKGSVPSATGSAKCPIRFLDHHAPEEVAEYFEKHKHEIPRSHAVCVKRYQSNEQSIRRLDAKYGNLVNMIQGLGLKHQPLFPGDPDEKSMEKVEKWAEDCADAPSAEMVGNIDETEARTGNFERLLQEVRLGESPSRPWGIRVPLTKAASDSSVAQSISRSMPAEHEPRNESVPGKCPFGHGAAETPTTNDRAKVASRRSRTPSDKTALPRGSSNEKTVVFNGPVFFGYSADEAVILLKSL